MFLKLIFMKIYFKISRNYIELIYYKLKELFWH